jgi:ElaA protein
MIDRTIKHFSELTPAQLYQILALRSEVFVVEQACIYQDR